MLTRAKVIDSYFAEHGKNIEPGNLEAFLRLAEALDAMESETYQEAPSMESIADEMDAASDEEEAVAIMQYRYRNLRRN